MTSFAKAKGEPASSGIKGAISRASLKNHDRMGQGGEVASQLRRQRAAIRLKKEGPNDGSESWLHRHTKNLLELSAAPGVLYMHTGNGLQRPGKAMNMLKNMGVRTGAFDWLIIVEGKAHWLELKKPGKEPSEEQLKFMDEARAAGCSAYVADDPVEVRAILWGWNAINVMPDTVQQDRVPL